MGKSFRSLAADAAPDCRPKSCGHLSICGASRTHGELSVARFDTTFCHCYFATVKMSTETQTEPSAVNLTESAARQIKEMLTNPENAGKNLRVYVEGGGCSGLQYGMVFDEKRPDDRTADFHGVSVLVDPFSANYLRGSVVDFSDELTGGGFKISNPNARQSCGCGKSFEA